MGELCIGRVRISAGALLVLAFLLWLGEEELLLAYGAAALVHELGHWGAARLWGLTPRKLTITAAGGELAIPGRESPAQDAFVLAAGPLCNLLEAGLCLRFGWILGAGAAILLALVNLLPAGPLDGGQLARLLCVLLFGDRIGCVIWAVTGAAVSAAVLLLGGWVFFGARGTPALLFFGIWLSAFAFSSFYTCVLSGLRVE